MRLDRRHSENVEMIPAERHAHRLRQRRDHLAQPERVSVALEDRHRLRPEVHNGDQAAIGGDPAGVRTRAALPCGRDGLHQCSGGVVDQQLVCRRVRAGDDERLRLRLSAYGSRRGNER